MTAPTYSCTPKHGDLRSINQAISELNDWKSGLNSWETELAEWIEDQAFRVSKMAIMTIRKRKNREAVLSKYDHLSNDAWIRECVFAA